MGHVSLPRRADEPLQKWPHASRRNSASAPTTTPSRATSAPTPSSTPPSSRRVRQREDRRHLHGVKLTAAENPGILIDIGLGRQRRVARESYLVQVEGGKQISRPRCPPTDAPPAGPPAPRRGPLPASDRAAPARRQSFHRGQHGRIHPDHPVGLATGSIYALAAIGFTLLWQASQTINFAQGEFVMLPAFFPLVGMLSRPAVRRCGSLRDAVSLLVLGLGFKLVVDPMIPLRLLPLVIATMALGDPHEGRRQGLLLGGGAALSLAFPIDDPPPGRTVSAQDIATSCFRGSSRRAANLPRPHHAPAAPCRRQRKSRRRRDPRHPLGADGALTFLSTRRLPPWPRC